MKNTDITKSNENRIDNGDGTYLTYDERDGKWHKGYTFAALLAESGVTLEQFNKEILPRWN